MPQAAQCHLEVAGAQFLLVVVVLEFALFPNLDGGPVARRRPAHAYAFRVITAMTKGGGPARAYPFAAAGVAFFLFFQTLLEELHQFVPAVFFDCHLFFGAT